MPDPADRPAGDQRDLFVAATPGRVWLGDRIEGAHVMGPETAREIARRLLVAADEADGRTPAHVYQVDNR